MQDAGPTRLLPGRSDKALILLAKSLSRGKGPDRGIVATSERECSPRRQALTEMSRFQRSRAFLAVSVLVRRPALARGHRFYQSNNVCSPAKWKQSCSYDHLKLNRTRQTTHAKVQTFMLTLQIIWTFTSP